MIRCWPALLVLAFVFLCSCSQPQASAEPVPKAAEASTAPVTEYNAEVAGADDTAAYVPELARQLLKELDANSADGEEAVRKIYRYMIENIYFADPVGLDAWRYLSDERGAIPYIENRSISPLLFKIGSCEDFAAAAVTLLEAAGFEARYVAGYTLSVDMVYIDHAWAVVKLGGLWYHLDPQLEQNVLRDNLLTYRYYLKSDDEMQADHKWGENLISYWNDMPEDEKENIRNNYLAPQCEESFARPEPESAHKPEKPNMADIEFQILTIKKQSGKTDLPPLLLNIEPPVLVRAYHITPPLTDRQPEFYKKINDIIAEIPTASGEFERALFIHDYLAKNVEYDTSASGRHSGEAYGAIVDRAANCDGYAKAFVTLCERAGLESLYISGKSARGIKHAWNAVRVDGFWYYADVTWDRPGRPGDGVYHDYFMLGFDEISLDHIPDEGQSLPPSQSAAGTGYYERKGYFVNDAQNRTQALAEAFFAQLESAAVASEFSGVPEPVFLEIKVLGGKQNYLEFKEHYIENAFNILKVMQELAKERKQSFKVVADTSVRCDFNNVTHVLTFYPNIQRLG